MRPICHKDQHGAILGLYVPLQISTALGGICLIVFFYNTSIKFTKVIARVNSNVMVNRARIIFGSVALTKAIGTSIYLCFALIRISIYLGRYDMAEWFAQVYKYAKWSNSVSYYMFGLMIMYVVRFLTITHINDTR